MRRCAFVGVNKPHYERYHDEEWGVPVHDDRLFFEMLILEGAQAGLNWETILKRRQAYRDAFYNFEPQKVALMTDEQLEVLRHDAGIIRHRLKIFSTRTNARVFCKLQDAFGSFDTYVWGFVDNKTIYNHPATVLEVQTQSTEAQRLSYDLKRRGMSFVGPTIIYAFMQATGLVNDHSQDCDWSKATRAFS